MRPVPVVLRRIALLDQLYLRMRAAGYPHDEHVDEPTLLNPVPQLVHLSVAPVLYSFAGHGSSPVRAAFDMYPAFTVVQYDAPAEE